ncbi:MAG: hypothetical protein P9L99_06945 [Candidatus Lernaella stagnicola]|nr:hypothetical protein [Candidatus Lernaella stagnicola]
MAKIDLKAEVERVQGILDGITRNGFWYVVFFEGGDTLTFHPYRLEVLGAKPVIGSDGSVKSWMYAILMIDRGFVDFGASMHGNHLHFVERLEWVRGGSGRIYAAWMWDENGVKIGINEIDASENPELAEDWAAYTKRLKKMEQRVQDCLETIRDEFGSMTEARFR